MVLVARRCVPIAEHLEETRFGRCVALRMIHVAFEHRWHKQRVGLCDEQRDEAREKRVRNVAELFEQLTQRRAGAPRQRRRRHAAVVVVAVVDRIESGTGLGAARCAACVGSATTTA